MTRRRATLTPRQRETLRWLVMGKSNAEIAQIMGKAPGTVKNTISSIARKYGATGTRSRVLVAVFAVLRRDLGARLMRELRLTANRTSDEREATARRAVRRR